MSLPRFSIKRLMAFVVLVGIALAAFVHPNSGWAILMSSLQGTMLLTSILGIVLRRGTGRAFWLGFALFGWTFSLLIFVFYDGNAAPPQLIWAMDSLFELTQAARSLNWEGIAGFFNNLMTEDRESESRIVQSLLGLMFALLGGRIAIFLSRREQPPDTAPRPD